MQPASASKDSFAAMNRDAAAKGDKQVGETAGKCPLEEEERERVRIVVRDPAFHLCTGRKYVLTAGGERFEGTTGNEGLVDHLIIKGAPDAVLTVWIDETPGAEPFQWELALRKLHPAGMDTGVQGRLHNLAFDSGEQGSEEELRLRAAKGDFHALFQRDEDDELESYREEDQEPPQISAKLAEIYESLDPEPLADDDVWIPAAYKRQKTEMM